MNNKIFITNKTDKKVRATISDKNTGNEVIIRELVPGNNEIGVTHLSNGTYNISLIDDNNDTYYFQNIIKD